jgi:hypothetical protein
MLLLSYEIKKYGTPIVKTFTPSFVKIGLLAQKLQQGNIQTDIVSLLDSFTAGKYAQKSAGIRRSINMAVSDASTPAI